MAVVKAFAVGEGDTSYISHNSDNFTIIDCCLTADNRFDIVFEIMNESSKKGISRFISTHPDEDHFGGIELLDQFAPISNFYVVKNEATKAIDTESFMHYKSLRDGSRAFYISKGCQRRWMNTTDSERSGAGIEILWPELTNVHFQKALADAKAETSYNNMSAVVRYSVADGMSFLWLGDLETQFMTNIEASISLQKTTVVFASHHGRESGKIPNSWLDKLQPEVIIIGEAPSRFLNYYSGYKTITQNTAGDIIMDCPGGNRIDFYTGLSSYGRRDWLVEEYRTAYPITLGHYTFRRVSAYSAVRAHSRASFARELCA